MTFTFELAAAANTVGITVDQKFKHRPWIVLRTADLVRVDFDAQFAEFQLVNNNIVSSGRGVLGDVFINALGEKCFLTAISMSICHDYNPFI